MILDDIFVYKEENLPIYNNLTTSKVTGKNVLGKVYVYKTYKLNKYIRCEKCSFIGGFCPRYSFNNDEFICDSNYYFIDITKKL